MNVADLAARLRIKPDKGSFDAADRLLTGVKVALGAIAAFKTVHFFAGLVEGTTELASRAVDVSKQLGITAEAVQELGYAAGQSGGSSELLEVGFKRLSATMAEAQGGSKEARKAFKSLGIDMRDLKGETLDQNFEVIAEAFRKMPDGADKAAAAMKIFGKSGVELIPLLNEGQAGIVKLREEAHELGGVIDNQTAAALEDFGDQQDKVKFSIQGLKNEIVVALLPTLREMTAGFLQWVKANRKIIAQRIAFVVRGIVAVLRVLGKALGVVIDVFQFFADHLGLAVTAALALGGAMLILKADSVAAALASAAAWVLALLPFLLLAAALAAVILIVQDLWSWMNGGDSVLKDLYNSFTTWLGETAIGRVLGGIKAAFAATFDWIAEKIQWAWNKIKAVVEWFQGSGAGNELTSATAAANNLNDISAEAMRRGVSFGTVQAERNARLDAAKTGFAADPNGAGPNVAKILGGPTGPGGVPAGSGSAGVVVQAPQMRADITVNAGAGADGPAIARALQDQLAPWWAAKMRELDDGAGEP